MEKIINVTKWLINDERYFVAYTATWCNPCKKIKPFVEICMSEFTQISMDDITTKPEHIKFIPHFEIVPKNRIGTLINHTDSSGNHNLINDDKSSDPIYSIQTSNSKDLYDFLKLHKVF